MKNLIFLCDGTAKLNCPEPPEKRCHNTNVAHLYHRLPKTPSQLTQYEAGLGSKPSVTRNRTGKLGVILSKVFGHGLTENIESGYLFLLENYEPGDRVFLFGFSRGAYAVRALSGMLKKCGLLHPEHAHLAPKATQLYNRRHNNEEAEQFFKNYSRPCPVHFIGVWDTIASLGYFYRRQRFFNAALTSTVTHGYHALAIDEKRPKFEPLLWDESKIKDHQTIQQVWFPGSHSDVGGGYKDRGLAEISLQWLTEHAQVAGLHINEVIEPAQAADPAGIMHKPWNTLNGKLLRFLFWGSRPRRIEQGAILHSSVALRQAKIDYRPDVLAQTVTASLNEPQQT